MKSLRSEVCAHAQIEEGPCAISIRRTGTILLLLLPLQLQQELLPLPLLLLLLFLLLLLPPSDLLEKGRATITMAPSPLVLFDNTTGQPKDLSVGFLYFLSRFGAMIFFQIESPFVIVHLARPNASDKPRGRCAKFN